MDMPRLRAGCDVKSIHLSITITIINVIYAWHSRAAETTSIANPLPPTPLATAGTSAASNSSRNRPRSGTQNGGLRIDTASATERPVQKARSDGAQSSPRCRFSRLPISGLKSRNRRFSKFRRRTLTRGLYRVGLGRETDDRRRRRWCRTHGPSRNMWRRLGALAVETIAVHRTEALSQHSAYMPARQSSIPPRRFWQRPSN